RERNSSGKLPAPIEETPRFTYRQARAALNVGGHHGVSLSVVQTISTRRPCRLVAASCGHLDPFALTAERLYVDFVSAGCVGDVGDQPALRRKAGKLLVGL